MAVNAGSSSLKFQLLNMPEEEVITEGIVERIGKEDAYFTIKLDGRKQKSVLPILNHEQAVAKVLEELVDRGIVKNFDEIKGVGHRVVHGGEKFKESVNITEEVIEQIKAVSFLAPLHNPGAISGINAFKEKLPNVEMVAVFDTAFHQTMEPEAYMYAVPYEWYEKYGVRKYGFHGTSHQFVAQRASELVGKSFKESKVITCHLGNGASIAAVKHGTCIDTSMGMTPLGGIPMGTRSGDIDPAIVEFISQIAPMSVENVMDALNKKSGYLGVSGVSNDSRDLEDGVEAGNERCKLALDIQYKRIADFIASYYAYMGGADAIVFTAGIGENSHRGRSIILNRLHALGVEVDEEANMVRGKEQELTTKNSKIRAFLIPTNEELVIARDTVRLSQN